MVSWRRVDLYIFWYGDCAVYEFCFSRGTLMASSHKCTVLSVSLSFLFVYLANYDLRKS